METMNQNISQVPTKFKSLEVSRRFVPKPFLALAFTGGQTVTLLCPASGGPVLASPLQARAEPSRLLSMKQLNPFTWSEMPLWWLLQVLDVFRQSGTQVL